MLLQLLTEMDTRPPATQKYVRPRALLCSVKCELIACYCVVVRAGMRRWCL